MVRPEYRVVIRAHGTNFAPGDAVAVIANPKNLGYAEYVNDVGEAFVTLSQADPQLLAALQGNVEDRYHMQILRGTDMVWAGWISETDETGNDVVIYAYNYVSGLFDLHTSWGQEWEAEQVDDIITDLWTRAKTTLSDSRMAWMTTGTIQTPVTTSGGAIAYVHALYRTYLKRILFAIQELVAASISDTTNTVVFEITPAGVFNLWKSYGEATDTRWEWGDPRLIGYRRLRTPVDRRNVLIGVGTSPRDIELRTTQTDSADMTARGRAEETIYLQWVRGQDELERVTKFRLKRARRQDQQLFLTFAPWSIEPFRSGSSRAYRLTDTVNVKIQNGITNIDQRLMVLGQQVVLHKGHEIVRPLMGDRM